MCLRRSLLLRTVALPLAAAGVLLAAGSAGADDPGGGLDFSVRSEGGKGEEGHKRPDGFTIGDPRIDESSGLAASRRHKGVYWTHNDSAHEPRVYAVDGRTGKTVATVTLRGFNLRDAEAISVGPHGDVYVGDIGDNLGGKWSEVWIYRFREPARLHDTTVAPIRYRVRYADGPRDAESLMVHPKTGRAYIVSKSNENKGAFYEGPPQLSASRINTFRRIARTDMWATDAAFSPDGTRLMVRGYFSGRMYAWRHGKPSALTGVAPPFQRQGESVTFTPDGRNLMFGSEGASSEVQPVELDGKALPENVAAQDRRSGGGDGGDGKSGESGAGGDSGSGGSGGEDGGHHVTGAAVTFAVAVALWLGARRLFRRRD